MRENSQPPYVPPMPPWGYGYPGMPGMPGMPWMYQHPQQQQQRFAPEIIVPARVAKAIEFVELMTFKTMARPAINEHEIEVIPGQKLEVEEANTLATACNMLSSYFAGKLKPDIWENLRVKALTQQVSQDGTPGRLLNCFNCQHRDTPDPECPICKGQGTVLITPISAQTGNVPQVEGASFDEDDPTGEKAAAAAGAVLPKPPEPPPPPEAGPDTKPRPKPRPPKQ